ncbi:MAG: hypothetical protein AAFY98_08260 [Verrucomicrobiota bacterium]
MFRSARSRVTLNTGTAPNTSSSWNASIPGHIYKDSTNNFLNGNVGDPRASYFIQAPQDASNYDVRSVVGGRTIRVGLLGNSYGEVSPEDWPDRAFNDNPGTQIGSDARTPLDVTPPASREELAIVSYRADTPGFETSAELGHIYDPGQWRQYSGTNLSAAKAAWRDITNSTAADNRYGGGFTLKIGSPEFTRFDQDGTRATELLALFTSDTTENETGKVNINTASREVLRALAAGIRLGDGTLTAPCLGSFRLRMGP